MDKRDTERGYSTSDIIHEYENMDPTEDYDAFNEDTFGNNVETWTKEDHDQLVGAHVTEVIHKEYNQIKYYPTLIPDSDLDNNISILTQFIGSRCGFLCFRWW